MVNIINVEAIAATASAIIAAVALVLALRGWEKDKLRHDHVHSWARDTIKSLRNFHVLAVSGQKIKKEEIDSICSELSSLADIGRLYFNNEGGDQSDNEKAPGYRGHRPEILDQILVAYRIGMVWNEADETLRSKYAKILDLASRRFVSLAKDEVGRQKVSSRRAARGGDEVHLGDIVRRLDQAGYNDASYGGVN